MYKIRKSFRFEAAHKLMTAETNECKKLHGHSYKVEVFLTRLDLNKDDMVEDFLIVKEAFQPVIDYLDHSIMLCIKDKNVEHIHTLDCGQIIQFNKNPTAEVIAEHIYENAILDFFSSEIKVEKIRVHETYSGYAEYFPHK